ncbi:restriction endonuclease subunit S [Alteromonas portus]|uniref:Restriction endonuclease subunit S n=1 Tax=Alteromonas portus TaxID=2565549 RepID=A0A4U0ZDT8_9ALTE|nr:restriction endonuclease subunit S [Alteromonas portus]TKB01995.1 restriction endonuclease subunit S [Alteromonas portus]
MMKAYPEYKDSGIEWLGQIPRGWKTRRLKYLCNLETGNRDTQDANPDGEYDFFVRAQKVEKIDSYTHECEAVLTAGDGVGVGKVFHYTTDKFSFHQRVYMMNKFKEVEGRYFYYYLSTLFARVALDGGAKSTVDSLRMPVFNNFTFTYPSIGEQQSILKFLDSEIRKINSLVHEKESFIKLLQEKRQALISHAVTKGLDDNVTMKPSGVDWIGDIPEHWDCSFIKRFCMKITDGAHISPDTENGIHHFISIRDIKNDRIDFQNSLLTSEENYNYLIKTGCKPEDGDVLFSKDGTIGKSVVVPEGKDFVVASSLIIMKVDKKRLVPEFLDFLCKSNPVQEQVNNFVRGAALKRLSITNILKIFGCFPPFDEQKEIVSTLKNKLSKLDSLIKETRSSIKLLKEHRTALISAAVTGKIDVREEV